MILRTGVDLLEVNRLDSVRQAIRERFLKRVYTTAELAESGNQNDYLAGRFAVKEAVSKALGTGIGWVRWQDIETLDGPRGEPVLQLHGNAAKVAQLQGLQVWSVSISHTKQHAVAVAVALGESNAAPPVEGSIDAARVAE